MLYDRVVKASGNWVGGASVLCIGLACSPAVPAPAPKAKAKASAGASLVEADGAAQSGSVTAVVAEKPPPACIAAERVEKGTLRFAGGEGEGELGFCVTTADSRFHCLAFNAQGKGWRVSELTVGA